MNSDREQSQPRFGGSSRGRDANPRPQDYDSCARLSGSLIASCFVAPFCIDALVRAAPPSIGKLRKLVLQRMPASFNGGHVVDELPNLAS